MSFALQYWLFSPRYNIVELTHHTRLTLLDLVHPPFQQVATRVKHIIITIQGRAVQTSEDMRFELHPHTSCSHIGCGWICSKELTKSYGRGGGARRTSTSPDVVFKGPISDSFKSKQQRTPREENNTSSNKKLHPLVFPRKTWLQNRPNLNQAQGSKLNHLILLLT